MERHSNRLVRQDPMRLLLCVVAVGVTFLGVAYRSSLWPDSPARVSSNLPTRDSAPDFEQKGTRPDSITPPLEAVQAKTSLSGEALWQSVVLQAPSPERNRALDAALKELSKNSPLIASEKLLSLHPLERVALVTALVEEKAVQSADDSVDEAIRFCDLDPTYSLEYGKALIAALANKREYPAALRFVLAEESEGWLGENGIKWVNTLFNRWGAEDPTHAMQSAETSVGPALRGEALQAVAAGWVKVAPPALADYAWKLPPDSDREFMLDAALRAWASADPAAASTWLKSRKE